MPSNSARLYLGACDCRWERGEDGQPECAIGDEACYCERHHREEETEEET